MLNIVRAPPWSIRREPVPRPAAVVNQETIKGQTFGKRCPSLLLRRRYTWGRGISEGVKTYRELPCGTGGAVWETPSVA